MAQCKRAIDSLKAEKARVDHKIKVEFKGNNEKMLTYVKSTNVLCKGHNDQCKGCAKTAVVKAKDCMDELLSFKKLERLGTIEHAKCFDQSKL